MQTAATTKTLVVVKIGGAAGVARDAICADVAALQRAGQLLLLVHGGSDMATQLGAQLGHPAQFVTTASGHSSRYTDARTLEIFLMATALLNRQLCARLNALGCSAVGLSGIDGGLLLADRKAVLQVVANGKRKVLRDDHTGSIKQVRAELLVSLLQAGHLPVIAPVAIAADGTPLNVDGDRAAAQLAVALGAPTLIVLSNVPGLLRDVQSEQSLISRLPAAELQHAQDALAHGRMKRKLLAAREALDGGVTRVTIADGRCAAPLSAALNGAGTTIS